MSAVAAKTFPLEWSRRQFPALARQIDGQPIVYLDGPAGGQVPQRVVDAMSHYLTEMNANHGGLFATSRQSDAMLDEAHAAVADLLGTSQPETTVFGANMTTLTFAFSRALARTWQPDDEVIVTRLDHDANVMAWVLAARDVGAKVRFVGIHPEDCTLDMDDLRRTISPRTRLVAACCASNAVGTINPLEEICRLAHDAGAQVFFDAVHYAPHALVDVTRWDCDYLVCSAYKFFAPHVGVLWGRKELLESLPAYKVRPASDQVPDRWMTGTPNLEGIAGLLATIEYLADLGRQVSPQPDRRAALATAFAEIGAYERELCRQLIAGLAELPSVRAWGITDPARFDQRVPTVSITHAKRTATELSAYLGQRGISTWHGDFYAPELIRALGLEPEGMVRLGLLHYNTSADIQRLLAVLRELE